MRILHLACIVSLTVFIASVAALAQEGVAPRQLLVLKPGSDKLWGTWVGAYINKGQVPVHVAVPVLLPREASDFQGGEGVEGKDLKISDVGLTVEKDVPPGVNVLSVVFAVPARYGIGQITLKPRMDLQDLSVMVPRGILDVSVPEFRMVEGDVQDGERYNILSSSAPIASGHEFVISAKGVPEGRLRLWILGAGISVILLLAAVLLVWRSRREGDVINEGVIV